MEGALDGLLASRNGGLCTFQVGERWPIGRTPAPPAGEVVGVSEERYDFSLVLRVDGMEPRVGRLDRTTVRGGAGASR